MSCLDCGLASKGSGLFQLPKITGIRFQAGNVSQLRLFICQAGEQGGDERFTLLHSYIRSSCQKVWNKMSLIKSQLFSLLLFFASELWLTREVWEVKFTAGDRFWQTHKHWDLNFNPFQNEVNYSLTFLRRESELCFSSLWVSLCAPQSNNLNRRLLPDWSQNTNSTRQQNNTAAPLLQTQLFFIVVDSEFPPTKWGGGESEPRTGLRCRIEDCEWISSNVCSEYVCRASAVWQTGAACRPGGSVNVQRRSADEERDLTYAVGSRQPDRPRTGHFQKQELKSKHVNTIYCIILIKLLFFL